MDIKVKLCRLFSSEFDKLKQTYGEDLAFLNGFSNKQLDYTDFIDNFVDKDVVADSSIDGNANVAHKNVAVLLNEMAKPHQKLLAFNKIFYELEKKYGVNVAKEFLEDEWLGRLYIHDANTSTFLHYCMSYDLKDLAEKGLFFIENFNAEPPKHYGTFIDMVKEFVSFASNSSSGAVGMANLIPYMYYFWKKDIDNNYYTETPVKYAKQHIQRLIYALNQPFLRGNTQSAFSNTGIFDRPYLEALFGSSKFPDDSYMVDEFDGIMEFQKLFLETMDEIREKNVFTFPVNTISLLKVNGKFVDEEFARYACNQNIKWAMSNFFVDDDISSLSNCCRLSSNIKDLYFNSIGGTALKVGSVKVCTINLARIAYESNGDKNKYFKILKDRVDLCCKILDVIRHIITRNVEKGIMKNFSSGLVGFEHLYNTIGILGNFETLSKFNYIEYDEFGNAKYNNDGLKFAVEILDFIHKIKDEFVKDKNYKINIEQVPAESCAAKLMRKDKHFFPNEKYELPLYGNQWIPLGVKTTLYEKIRVSAILDEACTGGSISHINLEAPFNSFNTAWNLLNYVSDQGVKYFAFCTKVSACKYNHGFYGDICPICGNPVETTYQRIVGFITPVKTYSKERKEEFYERTWFNLNDN
ncbi:MAG: anaerobic ribonucleoside-triphosphate reductase [Tenuifilaceae bacterium]|nr:anaerobic ribonucleoside-triphosphate reductase [Tenuifilaceae bacterium]